MLSILKLFACLFSLIIFGTINCGGDGGDNQNTSTTSTRSKRKHSKNSKGRKHKHKNDDKKNSTDDNPDLSAPGKDPFKRPDVLGMAPANDPKYATLKKVDVDKLLGDVGN
uniref:Uncharacterized protein n=1 Tax=Strongyloides venezuelensis TaxID=75913 RepID=A0A0K0FLI4_STRVS